MSDYIKVFAVIVVAEVIGIAIATGIAYAILLS